MCHPYSQLTPLQHHKKPAVNRFLDLVAEVEDEEDDEDEDEEDVRGVFNHFCG